LSSIAQINKSEFEKKVPRIVFGYPWYYILTNFMKDTFLKNEFWMLSIQGAFQRAGVYESNILENEYVRQAFRKGLREFIDTEFLCYYKVGVSEKNIWKIF